jgi:hypothetical protein
MLRKYGSDVVNDLESRENLSKKWSDDELNDLKVFYKRKLADLDNGIAPECGNEPLSVSSLWGDIPLTSSVSVLSVFDTAVSSDN